MPVSASACSAMLCGSFVIDAPLRTRSRATANVAAPFPPAGLDSNTRQASFHHSQRLFELSVPEPRRCSRPRRRRGTPAATRPARRSPPRPRPRRDRDERADADRDPPRPQPPRRRVREAPVGAVGPQRGCHDDRRPTSRATSANHAAVGPARRERLAVVDEPGRGSRPSRRRPPRARPRATQRPEALQPHRRDERRARAARRRRRRRSPPARTSARARSPRSRGAARRRPGARAATSAASRPTARAAAPGRTPARARSSSRSGCAAARRARRPGTATGSTLPSSAQPTTAEEQHGQPAGDDPRRRAHVRGDHQPEQREARRRRPRGSAYAHDRSGAIDQIIVTPLQQTNADEQADRGQPRPGPGTASGTRPGEPRGEPAEADRLGEDPDPEQPPVARCSRRRRATPSRAPRRPRERGGRRAARIEPAR